MALMFPLGVPLAAQLAQGKSDEFLHHIVVGTISSILAGSIFGDQCSPISDTSILSALSSGTSVTWVGGFFLVFSCLWSRIWDLYETIGLTEPRSFFLGIYGNRSHVTTQLPYALLVAFASILCGYLPVGYELYPGWAGLLVGNAFLVGCVYLLGTRTESEDPGRFDGVSIPCINWWFLMKNKGKLMLRRARQWWTRLCPPRKLWKTTDIKNYYFVCLFLYYII